MNKNYNYRNLLYFKKLLSISKKNNSQYFNILNSLQISDNFSLKYIKYVEDNKYVNFFFYRILNILKLIFSKNFTYKNIPNIKKYDSIIFTWGFKRNFDKKGNFKDDYLNINSKNKNCLILIVYLDKNIPQKINSNCVLFLRCENILKNILKNILSIISNKLSKKKYFHNYQFLLGQNLSKLIQKILRDVKFKKMLIPYDGALSQKIIIKDLKKNFKRKIVGIVHSFPQPLPVNFFFNKISSPDELAVNGKIQKEIFINHLGWNKKKIFFKKSNKYKKIKNFKSLLSNKIFLPYNLNDTDKVINSLENIKHLLNKDMEVCIHPQKKSNEDHIFLKKEIVNKLRDIKKNKSKRKKALSIFFDATTVIFIAVEKKIKVIQICSDENLYYYNPILWKGLGAKRLYENIFEYYKLNSKSLIEF